MKTLNAKRVAAIAAGAALLGVGLAFAGSVTFQNVPIISNSGQPVVQVVVGSAAKPSDGIAAANIAAAIGNLAYTSVPVSATVNATQAKKVLKVSVTSTSGSGSISNPLVWLNESSSAAPSGTYGFTALIGSVLNRAVLLGAPQNTKIILQGGTGSTSANIIYAYPKNALYTGLSVIASPYSSLALVPSAPLLTSTTGGVSFIGGSGFRTSGTAPFIYDNIMQVTNTQLSALLQNSGTYGESESLWLTGFPVFDQGTISAPVNQFAIAAAGGAYQATFTKPIPILTSGNTVNQASITLLGKTWTILNYTAPGGTGVNKLGTTVSVNQDSFAAGSITLAASLVPMTTVYVGHNLTTGPFTVQVTDLGQPNSNGVVPASLAVYYNGQLTNTSSAFPATAGSTVKFNVTGNLLFVKVNQTFAGLYQYQKWAKIQLFSNIQPMVSGNAWNSTTNPGWYVLLGWSNCTTGTTISGLQTIIAYNQTPVSALLAGQSLNFIGNPAAYKMTLAGDTLGANYDPLTIKLSSSGSGGVNYQNTYVGTGNGLGLIDNITEPVQLMTVTSQIPNAFSSSQSGSGQSVVYNLVPYQLVEVANAITANNLQAAPSYSGNQMYLYANTLVPYNGLVNANNPLQITVYGYAANALTYNVITITLLSNTVNAVSTYVANSPLATLYNVTKITLSETIPGLTVVVSGNALYNGLSGSPGNAILATLNAITPQILVPSTNSRYLNAVQSGTSAITYNPQTGSQSTFTLASLTAGSTTYPYNYFSYTANEPAVPGQATPGDALAFYIRNSTAGAPAVAGTMFQANYSTSPTQNNMSYTSTSSATMNVKANFRTERGSMVKSISPLEIDLNLAKVVDLLSIGVGPVGSNTVSTAYKSYGPYGLGQMTNLANVSIGKVTANATLGSGSTYSITGISNITATPTVSKATTPVLLTSLATTPLVVNDTMATSSTGSLILVGSGYVNTLSAQLQRSYNITMATSTQVDQAYGNRILVAGYYASQTTAAANAFIQQLYANAATSS